MSKSHLLHKLAVAGTVVFGIGIVASPSQAAVITNGCADTNQSCTLSELFAGATIQVGDKTFTNWLLNPNPVGGDTDNIQVSGIGQDTNAPGLKFTANNFALTVDRLDPNRFTLIMLDFDFLVTSLGEPIIDNELEFMSFVTPTGAFPGMPTVAKITEKVGTARGQNDLAEKDVFRRDDGITPTQELSDRAVFPEQQFVWVNKNIMLNPGPQGRAEITMFTQRFSQVVPEPSTVLGLLAIGGLGLGIKRKQEQK